MKNVFFIITSMMITYLIIEAANFGYYYVTATNNVKFANSFTGKMQPDNDLGYKLASNLDNYVYQSAIVKNTIFTDAEGFRNVGRSYATAELAYFGDSFVEPSGVNDEDSFHRIIEKKTKVKTVTFAVSGWALSHYSKALEVYLPKLPQVKEVVIVLYSNDFLRRDPNHLNSEFWAKYWTPKKGPTVSEVFFKQNLYSKFISVLKEKEATIVAIKQPYCERKEIQINGAKLWTRPRLNAAKANLKITGDFLLDDLALLRSQRPDVKFSVVLLPSMEYIWNELIADECPDKAKNIVDSVLTGHQYISQLGLDNGFNVYDASPALLQSFKQDNQLFIYNDGHLNEMGHKVLAAYLEDKF